MLLDREKEVVEALNTAILEKRVRVVEGNHKHTRVRMPLICIVEEDEESITYIPVAQLMVDESENLEIPRVPLGETSPEPQKKSKRAVRSPVKSAKRPAKKRATKPAKKSTKKTTKRSM